MDQLVRIRFGSAHYHGNSSQKQAAECCQWSTTYRDAYIRFDTYDRAVVHISVPVKDPEPCGFVFENDFAFMRRIVDKWQHTRLWHCAQHALHRWKRPIVYDNVIKRAILQWQYRNSFHRWRYAGRKLTDCQLHVDKIRWQFNAWMSRYRTSVRHDCVQKIHSTLLCSDAVLYHA